MYVLFIIIILDEENIIYSRKEQIATIIKENARHIYHADTIPSDSPIES